MPSTRTDDGPWKGLCLSGNVYGGVHAKQANAEQGPLKLVCVSGLVAWHPARIGGASLHSHSHRSAVTGSTLAARRAGATLAAMAAVTRSTMTPA